MGRRVAAVAAGLLAGVGVATPGGLGLALLAVATLVFAAGAWPTVRAGWEAYARSRRPGRLARALPRRSAPTREDPPGDPTSPPDRAPAFPERRHRPGAPD